MDPASRIGTTLRGKWRIERLLGTGGFASVYAATHRAGKRVAIKVLHTSLGASEEVRRRFLKEAYAANAVEHPAVVGVSDDDVTDDGAPFLVMDLLDGETVEARRAKEGGKLAIASVLHVVEEALGALVAAHAKGIVHRDLKPENLFLTRDGQVKVLDFGIARFREPGDESTATATGLTMGSPAFMAPEQARGQWSEVDARTDVYAMGATMFVLLSGRLVHGTRNLNAALVAAATRPAPPLSSVAPEVPEAVAAVVDRALEFEKERRWADARTMREAVRAARAAAATGTGTLPLGAAPNVGSSAVSWGDGAVPIVTAAATAGGAFDRGSPTAPLPPAVSAAGNTEVALPKAAVSSPLASSPITSSPPVVAAHAPVRRAGRTRVVAAIAGVAVLVVVGLVWLGTRGPTPPEGDSRGAVTGASQAGEVSPASSGGRSGSAAEAPSSSATAAAGAPEAPSATSEPLSPTPGKGAGSSGGKAAAAASKPATSAVAPTPGGARSAGGASGTSSPKAAPAATSTSDFVPNRNIF